MLIRRADIRPNESFIFNIGYGVIVVSEHRTGRTGVFVSSAFDNSWLYNVEVCCSITHPSEYSTKVTASAGGLVCVFIGY